MPMPARDVRHANASSTAGSARGAASAPGGRHGPPPTAGPPPRTSHSGGNSGQALAPLARHGLLPESRAPDPFDGLTIQPESGEAMQLVLISLAAMLLVGILFHQELKLGLRARQLVDRLGHREH
jgi:hypothetical protein